VQRYYIRPASWGNFGPCILWMAFAYPENRGQKGGLSTRIFMLSYLSVGLIVGLGVGLNRGGSAVTKHYALRLTL